MFKVGDKFIVEVDGVNTPPENSGAVNLYRIKDLNYCLWAENSLVLPEKQLEKLAKVNDLKDEVKEAYEKGLNDAWEAAREICAGRFAGKIDTGHILNFTATEALDKIKAYEEEQSEIRVGDEVEINDSEVIVTYVRGSKMYVLYGDGSTEEITVNRTEIRKTGRHFGEIESLLKILKGGDDSDEIPF
jgi:hypothetical protein